MSNSPCVLEDPDNITGTGQTTRGQIQTRSKDETRTEAVPTKMVKVVVNNLAIRQRKRDVVEQGGGGDEEDIVRNYERKLKRIELEEQRLYREECRTALEHSNAMRAIELSDGEREADYKMAMYHLCTSIKEKQSQIEDVQLKIGTG